MIHQTAFGMIYFPEDELVIRKMLKYYKETIWDCRSEEQRHFFQGMIDHLEELQDKLFRMD